jgi:hypothetical protein
MDASDALMMEPELARREHLEDRNCSYCNPNFDQGDDSSARGVMPELLLPGEDVGDLMDRILK